MNKIVIKFLIIVFYCLITISFQGCGNQGINVVYKYDAFGLVDTALAYRGESLIAKAEKIAIHPVERPIIIDIEVMETYFDPKTGEVIYTGKMFFRCKTNVAMGERIKVVPISGKKTMDVFSKWPYASMY